MAVCCPFNSCRHQLALNSKNLEVQQGECQALKKELEHRNDIEGDTLANSLSTTLTGADRGLAQPLG